MAGDIFAKERAIVTLTSTGASGTTGSAVAAGTDFDTTSAGNFPDDLFARFELTCQWATITNVIKDVVAADLYLVPKTDGTNLPDLDATSGSSTLPYNCYVGSFVCTKAPTANTNMRFVSPIIQVDMPQIYTAYILNKSGQTISANWILKAVSARGQYT